MERFNVGDPGKLSERPVRNVPATLTYVFGATVWSKAPGLSPDLRPTVSGGLIFSGNETESPMGLLLQGTWLPRWGLHLLVGQQPNISLERRCIPEGCPLSSPEACWHLLV